MKTNDDDPNKKNEHAAAMGAMGGAKGGRSRAARLSSEELSAAGRKAAAARWNKKTKPEDPPGATVDPPALPDVLVPQEVEIPPGTILPIAKHRGDLPLIGMQIPCYVLDNGLRVIGRTSIAELLSEIKGGGALDQYLRPAALRPWINVVHVIESMVPFRIKEVEGLGTEVKGLTSDVVIDICQGFVGALEANMRGQLPAGTPPMNDRQKQIAIRASMFLSACAKVGLDALIDEVTGYQYERAEDALQVKLRAYLSDELRKWEKTFPDQLWAEFGRLTNWKGSIYQRPKYWGKLVMELVYECLDPDVATWLKEHKPAPRHGMNYHQWLTGQYGLKKLTEHIWMLIGIAKTCTSMIELRRRMGEMFGKIPVQYMLFMPAQMSAGPQPDSNKNE